MEDEEGVILYLPSAPRQQALEALDFLQSQPDVESGPANQAKEELAALLRHLLAGSERQLRLESEIRQLEESPYDPESLALPEREALEVEASALRRELEAGEIVEVNWKAQLETMHEQQEQLQATIAAAKREARAASPAVADLIKAIKALTLDVAAERDNIAALRHQVANVQADVDAKDKRNEGEEASMQQVKVQVDTPLPPPSTTNVEELQKLQRQLKELNKARALTDTRCDRAAAADQAAEARLNGILASIKAQRTAQEDKEKQIAQIAKDMELARLQGENLLAERVELEAENQKAAAEVRRQQQVLWRTNADANRVSQALHNAQAATEVAKDQLVQVQAERAQDKALAERLLAKQALAVQAIKKEIDMLLLDVLNREDKSTAQKQLLMALLEDVDARDEEVLALRKAELARQEALRMAASKRDAALRYIALQERQLHDARASHAAGQPAAQEAVGSLKDHEVHEAELRALFDMLRQQRNKSSHLRKAAVARLEKEQQAQAAMEGQLQNLVALAAERLAAATSQRNARSTALRERDNLRRTLNRVLETTLQHQDGERTVQAEASALQAATTATQTQTKALDARVQALQLASQRALHNVNQKDNLLSSLQERHDAHEDVCGAGGLELQRLEGAARTLRLHIAQVERGSRAAKQHLPHVAELDNQVALLKMRLLMEQRYAAQLSRQLEIPTQGVRWQALGGPWEQAGELSARASVLQERLTEQEGRLTTTALALEETTLLASHLASTAAERRPEHLALARQANETHVKLRDATRGLMATASELSLYKVAVLEEQQKHASLRTAVVTALERVERGEPPSDEALAEWELLEAADDRAAASAKAKPLAMLGEDKLAHSQAEARPHSYVPEGTLQVKPYGNFPAFKPEPPLPKCRPQIGFG